VSRWMGSNAACWTRSCGVSPLAAGRAGAVHGNRSGRCLRAWNVRLARVRSAS